MIKSNYILYTVRWYHKLLKKKKKIKKKGKKSIFGCKNKGLQLN